MSNLNAAETALVFAIAGNIQATTINGWRYLDCLQQCATPLPTGVVGHLQALVVKGLVEQTSYPLPYSWCGRTRDHIVRLTEEGARVWATASKAQA